MTARVLVRWSLVGAMCVVMFLLGQWSASCPQPPRPHVQVLTFQMRNQVWIVPCLIADWPNGPIDCGWTSATLAREEGNA